MVAGADVAPIILHLIGNTPLLEIRNLNKNKKVRIFAKLEGMNPSGSVKDRAALFMVLDAERDGRLTHEKIILEATSGNTGIALAMIAASRGYKMTAVMSENASIERRQMMEALGARIILTPGEKGTDGAILKAHELMREHPELYFMPNQFDNPSNVRAHYETTAKEILEQTNGKIDVFVAGMGTTGTLMGCAKRFKEYNKKIKIVGVEPMENHCIQGLKNMNDSMKPKIYNPEMIDMKTYVTDDEAFQTTRTLASKEGIFAGMSSGAAMFAALQLAEHMKTGTIVVILPDRGERYLSTNLFGE